MSTGKVADAVRQPVRPRHPGQHERPRPRSTRASRRSSSTGCSASREPRRTGRGRTRSATSTERPATPGPSRSAFATYPEYKDAAWNNPNGDPRHGPAAPRPALRRVRPAVHSRRSGSISLGVVQASDTGAPYGAVGTVRSRDYVTNPGYETPPASVTYYYTARDAFRTDDIKRTDLSLNYAGKIGPVEIFVQPQVVNVFNNRGKDRGQHDRPDLRGRPAANYANFNPFTTVPTQGLSGSGANWDYARVGTCTAANPSAAGALAFGSAHAADYQQPRTCSRWVSASSPAFPFPFGSRASARLLFRPAGLPSGDANGKAGRRVRPRARPRARPRPRRRRLPASAARRDVSGRAAHPPERRHAPLGPPPRVRVRGGRDAVPRRLEEGLDPFRAGVVARPPHAPLARLDVHRARAVRPRPPRQPRLPAQVRRPDPRRAPQEAGLRDRRGDLVLRPEEGERHRPRVRLLRRRRRAGGRTGGPRPRPAHGPRDPGPSRDAGSRPGRRAGSSSLSCTSTSPTRRTSRRSRSRRATPRSPTTARSRRRTRSSGSSSRS